MEEMSAISQPLKRAHSDTRDEDPQRPNFSSRGSSAGSTFPIHSSMNSIGSGIIMVGGDELIAGMRVDTCMGDGCRGGKGGGEGGSIRGSGFRAPTPTLAGDTWGGGAPESESLPAWAVSGKFSANLSSPCMLSPTPGVQRDLRDVEQENRILKRAVAILTSRQEAAGAEAVSLRQQLGAMQGMIQEMAEALRKEKLARFTAETHMRAAIESCKER